MKKTNREELNKKLKEILELGIEDERVISEYIQEANITDIFEDYESLPLTQDAKIKINALRDIVSYQGES